VFNQRKSTVARGGKRAGSGRPQGALTKRTREIAERALVSGKTPLDIMLENMRYFHQLALDAEATLAGLTYEEFVGKHGSDLNPADQFKALLAEVKKTAGLRQFAQECAADAAPFMHPRLAAIQHSGELNIKRPAEMSDDELANIAARGSENAAAAQVDPQKLN
jgi:hypothetical protein